MSETPVDLYHRITRTVANPSVDNPTAAAAVQEGMVRPPSEQRAMLLAAGMRQDELDEMDDEDVDETLYSMLMGH